MRIGPICPSYWALYLSISPSEKQTEMASTVPVLKQSYVAASIQPSKPTSIKKLAESPNLNSIPSNYTYFNNPHEASASEPQNSIPIIDVSLLTSDNPDIKSKAIDDLDKACQDWGFFMIINHGIPESLMKAMTDVANEFFNLAEEDKPKFEPKDVLEPIRYGTSFNTAKEKVFCWRDFLKVFIHPEFHSPDKPNALRELLLEYSERTRNLVRILIRGISESLGLEENEMEKTLNLDSGLQILVANYYPPCPQPELALGMPPHSDHGLFTILMQNQVGGLQIQHKGEWLNVNALPNSILVNTGDHLEIFSNGKYKSVLHRAVVNNKNTRISIAMANGPSMDTIVCPASKLLESKGCSPAYVPNKYKEYLFSQQNNSLDRKSILDRVKVGDN